MMVTEIIIYQVLLQYMVVKDISNTCMFDYFSIIETELLKHNFSIFSKRDYLFTWLQNLSIRNIHWKLNMILQ